MNQSLHKVSHEAIDLREDDFHLRRWEAKLSVYERAISGHGDLEEVAALIPGEMLDRRVVNSADRRVYEVVDHLFTVLGSTEDGITVRAWGKQEKVDDLMEKVGLVLVQDPPSGQVYVMVKSMRGYGLHSCGQISSELKRSNYAKPTLDRLDHVSSCMRSKEPCGRLVVMDGPPGTGKSYAIRALTCSVKATFVLVAPSLVGQLSGPDIVPVLLEHRGKGPIVLIMEDADAALIDRRTGGDLHQLSEILNLGDGLLGELLDVRIVATTNAGRVDLDAAVKRPGRLCRHINFTTLNPWQAENVYSSLMEGRSFEQDPSPRHFKDGTTLAQVYMLARGDGWEPEPKRGGGHYL